MTIVESTRQALRGMQSIEHEIIAQVRARGVPIAAPNFTWNRGASLAELPALVHMEVRAGSRHASSDWSYPYLEDSWDRIDRWEVRQEIERIVDALAPR